MDPKYIHVDKRDGKQHVLYAGLLNEAHQNGLHSIETALVQVPTADNANVAICQATVTLARDDGTFRKFSGIGDASPQNVNRVMATALIRMAETRAKARALRDAINIGEALADDPTDLDEQEPPVEVPARPAAQPAPKKVTPQAWYQAAMAEARRRRLDIEGLPEWLAPDAEPEYAQLMCRRLKERLQPDAQPGQPGGQP